MVQLHVRAPVLTEEGSMGDYFGIMGKAAQQHDDDAAQAADVQASPVPEPLPLDVKVVCRCDDCILNDGHGACRLRQITISEGWCNDYRHP